MEPITPDELHNRAIEIRRELHQASTGSSPHVQLQIEIAALQSELWRVRQILADIAEDFKEARYCSRESLHWEEQKTRAIKYGIADRLSALEAKAAGDSEMRGELTLLAGGG